MEVGEKGGGPTDMYCCGGGVDFWRQKYYQLLVIEQLLENWYVIPLHGTQATEQSCWVINLTSSLVLLTPKITLFMSQLNQEVEVSNPSSRICVTPFNMKVFKVNSSLVQANG